MTQSIPSNEPKTTEASAEKITPVSKRNLVVPIRFSVAERDHLKKLAEKHKMSLSQFVRRRVLDETTTSKIDQDTYNVFCEVATDFKEMLKRVNTSEMKFIDQNTLCDLLGVMRKLHAKLSQN